MSRLALAAFYAAAAWGQCAMCFRTAEAQSRARAEALNQGILILALPLAAGFVFIGGLAYQRRSRNASNANKDGPSAASGAA
ncbi:MAG TPA: hypothetical protein VFQ91_00220 [Bryobacteraceae bacterium]|nr:hypothetical protein [Bryobacteraceae bacterium]